MCVYTDRCLSFLCVYGRHSVVTLDNPNSSLLALSVSISLPCLGLRPSEAQRCSQETNTDLICSGYFLLVIVI